MQQLASGLRTPAPDEAREYLAIVEAEVGSLLELLPVPIVVTTESGEILRANPAAGNFLDSREALVGRHIEDVLAGLSISVRMRVLCHRRQARRLYVLQHPAGTARFSAQ